MKCSVCGKPTEKYCSRCRARYYCSPSCQKSDYANHKLDCPSRSADILVKNVFDDTIPTKTEVLYEYGFWNCMNPRDQCMLFGLYVGLIKMIGCSASQLHSWWEDGKLPINIKKTFDDAGTTSEYYKWFLKNDHVLQGLRKYEGEKTDKTLPNKYEVTVRRYLSEHDQTVPFESLPDTKKKIFKFYLVMNMGFIPSVETEFWIDFGFCTCRFGRDYLGEAEEKRLGDLYRELIIEKGCMIDEFHDAYMSGSVVDLLRRKCSNCDWLLDRIEVPRHNQPIYSVYYLKQYVLSESAGLQRSVKVDYGFINCHTEDEIMQLKHMYRKLVKSSQFDAPDLHKACIAGKIFDYVKSILPNEVLKTNLLKNPYPLKDL